MDLTKNSTLTFTVANRLFNQSNTGILGLVSNLFIFYRCVLRVALSFRDRPLEEVHTLFFKQETNTIDSIPITYQKLTCNQDVNVCNVSNLVMLHVILVQTFEQNMDTCALMDL